MVENHRERNNSIVSNLTKRKCEHNDMSQAAGGNQIKAKKVNTRKTDSTADISAMFASADALLPIDTERKNRTLEKLRQEVTDKEVLLISNRRKIWLNQMRYADRSMIVFHILDCVIMLFLMVMMDIRQIDNESIIATSMILAGVLGSLSVLEIGKVCFAKLSELSETCFFNVRQMAAFDMIVSGIINLTALSAGILFVGVKWKIWLLQIGLYILVPFIFAQCVCLGVLLTEAGRKKGWLTAVAGIFLCLFYAILASTPQLYTPAALFIWGIALVVGGIILGLQTKALFTEISKGEILCMNWN